MLEPLLNYEQAAGELGISVRNLRCLVYSRAVPHLRLGHRTVKFRRSEIERALKKRMVKEIPK
jgi:excisionase family DNA binding protein